MTGDKERSKSPMKSKGEEGHGRRTHFNPDEMESIVVMYKRLTKPGKMDRLRFREVIHTTFDLTDDVMLDRIFRAFDSNNDSLVDGSEWVQGLSIFLRGSLEEHINFAYFCYDINGDRSLTREELYHCLKNCLIRTTGIEEDVEESVKEIVEIAMRKLDMDKNGQITFLDFQAAVQDDPLLLEACGPCLPSPRSVHQFFINLQNFQRDSKNKGHKGRRQDTKGTNRRNSSSRPRSTD